MRVTLTFLGSGDAFGSDGRFQTCLALRGGPATVLVDCGASSLIAMKRFGVAPGDVAAVVLSHLHGDHFGGLPFLVLDGQFTRRTAPLMVAGPPGVRERVERAMEVLFPGSSRVERRFAVDYVELAERVPTTVAGVPVTAYAVEHASGAPAYALRLAARLGARRVVLTHMGPSMLERRAEADFECASDGLVLTLE